MLCCTAWRSSRPSARAWTSLDIRKRRSINSRTSAGSNCQLMPGLLSLPLPSPDPLAASLYASVEGRPSRNLDTSFRAEIKTPSKRYACRVRSRGMELVAQVMPHLGSCNPNWLRLSKDGTACSTAALLLVLLFIGSSKWPGGTPGIRAKACSFSLGTTSSMVLLLHLAKLLAELPSSQRSLHRLTSFSCADCGLLASSFAMLFLEGSGSLSSKWAMAPLINFRRSTMSFTVAVFVPRNESTISMNSGNFSCFSSCSPYSCAKMKSAKSTRPYTSTFTASRSLVASGLSIMASNSDLEIIWLPSVSKPPLSMMSMKPSLTVATAIVSLSVAATALTTSHSTPISMFMTMRAAKQTKI
mmetsp:Transcript_82772/g.229791  ORF Transcript_82772/g.229791 Transcript_82772/m.229791 type:complete len:357 (-) Transcript_82772:625-1695(-)